MPLQAQFKNVHEAVADHIRNQLPKIIGEEAVNFSLLQFDQQAWSGYSQEVWPKRQNPNKWGMPDDTTRALLVKTAKLKKGNRVTRIEGDAVYIGNSDPSAAAHNFGFRGEIRQTVNEFNRTNANGTVSKVKAFIRTIHQNIPKRMFIGGDNDSPYLKARLYRVIRAELNLIIRKLNNK